jgi:hypothetical protein
MTKHKQIDLNFNSKIYGKDCKDKDMSLWYYLKGKIQDPKGKQVLAILFLMLYNQNVVTLLNRINDGWY